MSVQTAVAEVLSEALGRRHRANAGTGSSGGPAGNARLTAWIGLALLVLVLAELVTLLDVTRLISWHIFLGVLIVGLTLIKTASTTWRIVRYYTGHTSYRAAGPPPTPLRLLGPVVVLTAVGLLGSGIALIALGSQSGRRPLVTVLGFGLSMLTVHQAMFFAFAAAAGVHVLARLVPAVTTLTGRVERAVPGGSRRMLGVLLALGVAALVAALVLGTGASWRHDDHHGRRLGRASVAVSTQR